MKSIQQVLALRTVSTPHLATPEPIHPRVARFAWSFEAYHPALGPVLPAVKRFCSAVLNGGQPCWLSLLGPSGVGKTYILKQAFKLLSRAASGGEWQVRTATGWRGPSIAHLIPAEDLQDYKAPRDYGRHDLVYVEDIGSGAGLDRGSGAVLRSRIAELLQLRAGRWTLIDANLARREIAERLDSRVASRLKRDGSVLIELPADVPDFNG